MILFFSATGNSRFAAGHIGHRLNDDVVDLLPYLRGERTGPLYSDRPWVVVAPVYVEDMAILVADWLKAARLEGSSSIYFVMTTASTMGRAGYTGRRIARQKGMTCMGSAEIRMPTNYPIMFRVPEDETSRAIIRQALPVLDAAAGRIAAGQPIDEKPFSPVMDRLFGLVGTLFYRLYVRPKRFYATDSCVSCGRCARACPMINIRMAEDRPAWGGRCVHCMACVSACPTEAVEYGKALLGKRRYHFPKNI